MLTVVLLLCAALWIQDKPHLYLLTYTQAHEMHVMSTCIVAPVLLTTRNTNLTALLHM